MIGIQLRKFRPEVGAFGNHFDAVFAELTAHGTGVGVPHQGNQTPNPRHCVVARVVRDREVAAGLEDPGNFGEGESGREAMQGLRGSDDVEMTRQEGQRLDLADDVPASS